MMEAALIITLYLLMQHLHLIDSEMQITSIHLMGVLTI